MNHRHHLRPIGVAFVGRLSVVLSAMWVVPMVLIAFASERQQSIVYFASLLLSAVLSAFFGCFLLKGANWARILYWTASLPLAVITTLVAYGAWAIPPVLFVVLASLSLFSRRANRFFRGDTGRAEHEYPLPPPAVEGHSPRHRRFDY